MHIARSRSVPVNDKEASLKGMDSFFRVIPSTPRVKEGDIFPNASEANDTGKFVFQSFIWLLFLLFPDISVYRTRKIYLHVLNRNR